MTLTKAYLYTGYLVLFLILCMSVILYQERVFYIDSANQLFHMINEKSFTIFVERYSMYLNQSLPMIFVATGASVKTIAINYSISFILIHIICFSICWYVFKNIEACIVIFTCLIMYRHAFYHAISETYLFMAYSALFYAFLSYQIHNKVSGLVFYTVSILLIMLNYYMHPVTLFTVLFSLIFVPLFYEDYKKPKYYILLFFILCIYLQKFFFPGQTHNTSFFSELKHADVILPTLLSSYPVEFVTHRMNIYIFPLILLGLSVLFYSNKKKWILLSFQLSYLLFFFLITAITFHKGDSDMAMESRFAPLYLFIALPLFTLIKKNTVVFTATYALTFVILIYSLVAIYKTGVDKYGKRLKYLTNITNKAELLYPNKKFVVKAAAVDKDILWVKWGTSYEMMLLSTLNDTKNCVTLFIEEPAKPVEAWVYSDVNVFLYTDWWIYRSQTEINKKRFDLKELPYVLIPDEEVKTITP